MTRLPVTNRNPEDPLAHVQGRVVTVGSFLGQASRLAETLPPGRYAINFCRNRYAFSLGFMAAVLAGKTNLLPGNRLPGTLKQLMQCYPDAFVISDEEGDEDGTPHDRQKGDQAGPVSADPRTVMDMDVCTTLQPSVPEDHLAAVVFTSGSTGPCKPIEKPWRTLLESTLINARELGLDQRLTHLLATVPPQHMYGLETSVLLPLFAPVAVSSAHPFLPQAVALALAALPEPRVLVSTPVHLRSFCGHDWQMPRTYQVVSATAPLDPVLAQTLETEHNTRVLEVYGCSETGCLARRAVARTRQWQPFEGFELVPDEDSFRVRADHLPRSYLLQDHLRIHPDGRFDLVGRSQDLVNIAGKRASLADLNQRLLRLPGIQDGAIFQAPGPRNGQVTRLAALVVAPDLSVRQIRTSLSKHMDSAFVPRPIRKADTLPRSPTGKLSHTDLLELFTRSAGTPS